LSSFFSPLPPPISIVASLHFLPSSNRFFHTYK
jgi:hypothetical protein